MLSPTLMTKFWLDLLKLIYWSFSWVWIYSIFINFEMHFTITFWFAPTRTHTHYKMLFHILISIERVIRCYWRVRECQFAQEHNQHHSQQNTRYCYIGNLYKFIQTRDLNIMIRIFDKIWRISQKSITSSKANEVINVLSSKWK